MVNESIVLAKVNVGAVDKALNQLKKYKEVSLAASTAGEYDLIIFVNTNSLEELHDFIVNKVHGLKDITSTQTHIIAKKFER